MTLEQERGSWPLSKSIQLHSNLLDRQLRNRSTTIKYYSDKVPALKMDPDNGASLDGADFRALSSQ